MKAEELIYASYMKALPYIEGRLDRESRKPELADKILAGLHHPERDFPIILVTGSKGKGSVSRMIAFLLEKLGYKVGHFSGPHLVDFRERIRVNGRAIRVEAFEEILREITPLLENIEQDLQVNEYISPIAISQGVALQYFKKQGVQVGVIECGRGGTYDDTNRLPHEVAVITPVMEEHLDRLGPKLRDIVQHKLGIITPEVRRVYIGKQREDVMALMKPTLNMLQKDVKVTERQFFTYGHDFLAKNQTFTFMGTRADLFVGSSIFSGVQIPLLGNFQAENLALAMAVVQDWTNGAASNLNWNQHLPYLRWPGRGEIIGQKPLIVLDGGVHRDSAIQIRNLIASLPHTELRIILGLPMDKDVEGVVKVWAQVADQIITTKATNPFLNFTGDYAGIVQKYTDKGMHIPDLEEAVGTAKEGLDEKGILVIMGTQSLVGDIKRMWGESILNL